MGGVGRNSGSSSARDNNNSGGGYRGRGNGERGGGRDNNNSYRNYNRRRDEDDNDNDDNYNNNNGNRNNHYHQNRRHNNNEEEPSATWIPGTATLEDIVDEKVMVFLRDGRKLYGILRSYDQFANLVLHDTIERIFVGNDYADLERGLFLVRGENVVLIGQCTKEAPATKTAEEIEKNDEEEVDDDENPFSSMLPAGLEKKPVEEILEKHQESVQERERQEKWKQQVLSQRGFSIDPNENDAY